MKVYVIGNKRQCGNPRKLVDIDLSSEIPKEAGSVTVYDCDQLLAYRAYPGPIQCIVRDPHINDGSYRFGFVALVAIE